MTVQWCLCYFLTVIHYPRLTTHSVDHLNANFFAETQTFFLLLLFDFELKRRIDYKSPKSRYGFIKSKPLCCQNINFDEFFVLQNIDSYLNKRTVNAHIHVHQTNEQRHTYTKCVTNKNTPMNIDLAFIHKMIIEQKQSAMERNGKKKDKILIDINAVGRANTYWQSLGCTTLSSSLRTFAELLLNGDRINVVL